jgi:hypothetical protein
MDEHSTPVSLGLNVAEWVEIRSKTEILSTLDKNGRLDELPFMPQMLQYCGQKLKVSKRAHKLCDTVHGTGGLKISNTVVLENVRCDGQAYGGCEIRCTILWKEAWLKRAVHIESASQIGNHFGRTVIASPQTEGIGCSEDDIWAGTRVPHDASVSTETVYVCQATQLPRATEHLPMWAIGQYFEDYTSGNVPMSEILVRLLGIFYYSLADSGLGVGSALRWMYDVLQRFRGASPYPCRLGYLPSKSPTPSINLNIQVGEVVRVKDYHEILKTVDENLINRGMGFHPEMVTHCGKTFRVLQRARKIMDEKTGKLKVLKNECLVLEGADCFGRTTKPLFCPRSCYPYWREIWLERVSDKVCGTEGQAKLQLHELET